MALAPPQGEQTSGGRNDKVEGERWKEAKNDGRSGWVMKEGGQTSFGKKKEEQEERAGAQKGQDDSSFKSFQLEEKKNTRPNKATTFNTGTRERGTFGREE